MVGSLPQSTGAFTSGCPFSIDAPSSVEALFRRGINAADQFVLPADYHWRG